MKTILTLTLFFTVQFVMAQPSFEWANQIGGASGNDNGNAIVADANGDILIGGSFSGIVDFDPGVGVTNLTSMGSVDAYLAKYSSSGDFIWAKNVGSGTSNCWVERIQMDSFGNIILAGQMSGTVDFDPGAGVSTSTGSNDWFVSKLDQAGNYIWSHSMGSTSGDDLRDLEVSPLNEVIVVGYFAGATDFDPGPGSNIISPVNIGQEDGFVYKLNSAGGLIWVRTFQGTSQTTAYGADVNSLGEICITGSYRGTIDLDPTSGVLNATSNGLSDVFVVKLDDLGGFIWGVDFGGANTDSPRGLEIDGSGNIVSTGIFEGNMDIDPSTGSTIITSNGGFDTYFQKLSPSGGFIWGGSVGGSGNLDWPTNIRVDNDDNILIAGIFENTVDFDPNTGTNNITVQSSRDGYILKLASNMIFSWAGAFNGSDADACNDVISTQLGSVYYIGGSNGTVDIDPTASTQTITCGGYDLFFGELCTPVPPVPDISSLPNLTGECSVSAPSAPSASNCAGSYTGAPDVSFPITSSGTTVVTWTYDDGNGNTSTQTQDVIIDDVTAPVADIASLSDVTAQCEVTSLIAPTATDNCVGTIAGTHNATLPITTTTTITWTYDDGNGNTSTQTQEVIINDLTAPVADAATLANVTDECEIPALTAPTATDNCVGNVTGTHSATLPITSTTTLIWTYDDGNGNTSTQTQEVIIDDVTAPVTDIASLSDLNAQCEVTSLTAPTATDNCVGAVTGTHGATLPITSTTTITWTYDDGNGNTSTQTQELIIDDVTAPVADAGSLSDLTDECEITSLTAPTATDNCAGTITGTHGVTLPITSTTTITWTYDDGNGNTSTQTQEVIIDDVTAPVADAASLADLTDECEITALTEPTATDNCAGSVTVTNDATLPITSTTTITWSYDDGNGNTSTQTQEVIIDDVTAPVADAATLANLTDECEITSLTAPTATDNCSGSVSVTNDATLPITSTTTITWTYDDGNGNTSTQTQEVIITPIDNGVTIVDDIKLSADASGYTYQWVDCENGNAAIAGQTNQTFEATANGSYAVVIDNGDCSVTSSCFDITTVGLDNNEFQTINVFPNPTSGTVTINSSAQFNTVEVVNVMGQVVYSTTLNEVNTHKVELPEAKGVYLIKVSGNNTNNTFRIIKK